MTVFEELKRRGLIAQTTNEEEIQKLFDNESVTFYIGFDATADSLHVGHFLQLVIMKRLQMAARNRHDDDRRSNRQNRYEKNADTGGN